MDPEANIAEQLLIARRIAGETHAIGCDMDEDCTCAASPEDAQRLAELVLALDGWLRVGGALPSRWEYRQVRR